MARTPKTNAVRLLESAGIPFETLAYDLAGREFSAGSVAAALGLEANRVFKTLAARDTGATCLAVVPGDADLDLKALARATGSRRLSLLPVADLEATTGYRRGSVTALGTRRPLPVFLDESALTHDQIAVSAGATGLQVMLSPQDYVEVTGAVVCPIARG